MEINNKKAYFNYEILDKIEAGIALVGCEVKSIREGNASIKESFARIKNGELYLLNMHVTPYPQGNRENPEPTRERKLLLKASEIKKLTGKLEQKGFNLIPLRVYLKKNRYVKVLLGLGRSKKLYDKREAIKKKTIERELSKKYNIKGT